MEAARRDLDATDADNAVSRAYYAAFHAATAALHEAGRSAKTHKGTHALFYHTYVETGRVDRQHSSAFANLFRDRREADYSLGPAFSYEGATDALRQAEAFVEAIEHVLAD